jgi:hypothetical protein
MQDLLVRGAVVIERDEEALLARSYRLELDRADLDPFRALPIAALADENLRAVADPRGRQLEDPLG